MLLLVLQRWRRYDTRGSWRSAGLEMSREGSQLVGYRHAQWGEYSKYDVVCVIYMDMSCEYVYGIVARYGADVTCVRSVVLARHVELLTDLSCGSSSLGQRSARIFL